ncbi:hypothetical protein [Pectobacterium sp. CHL-2024]|uniref:hypothetical protein n=1 Tax=Pectobacterium sp. CHL-2024 TaxID=3377079 RepID=UPI0038111808
MTVLLLPSTETRFPSFSSLHKRVTVHAIGINAPSAESVRPGCTLIQIGSPAEHAPAFAMPAKVKAS